MRREDAKEYTEALGQVVAGGWRQVALGERLGVPAALGLSVEEWVQNHLGGYVRMSIPDRREAVAELTEEGMSTREIGDVLGVTNTTVNSDQQAVRNLTAEPAEPSHSKDSGDAAVRNLTAEPAEPSHSKDSDDAAEELSSAPTVASGPNLGPVIDAVERDRRFRRVKGLKLIINAEGVGACLHGHGQKDDAVEAAQHDDAQRHAADLRESARLLCLVADEIASARLRRVQ